MNRYYLHLLYLNGFRKRPAIHLNEAKEYMDWRRKNSRPDVLPKAGETKYYETDRVSKKRPPTDI